MSLALILSLGITNVSSLAYLVLGTAKWRMRYVTHLYAQNEDEMSSINC